MQKGRNEVEKLGPKRREGYNIRNPGRTRKKEEAGEGSSKE